MLRAALAGPRGAVSRARKGSLCGRVGNLDFLPHATKLGAMAALPKPFTPRQLVQLVERCIKSEAPMAAPPKSD
jgi:DNA-binding NtrC family response regulator